MSLLRDSSLKDAFTETEKVLEKMKSMKSYFKRNLHIFKDNDDPRFILWLYVT